MERGAARKYFGETTDDLAQISLTNTMRDTKK
jgi:hypothetical protein